VTGNTFAAGAAKKSGTLPKSSAFLLIDFVIFSNRAANINSRRQKREN
jgi:hypothetical protein